MVSKFMNIYGGLSLTHQCFNADNCQGSVSISHANNFHDTPVIKVALLHPGIRDGSVF